MIKQFDSRKLQLVYISLIASTAVAWVYVSLIPTVADFLEYFPDKSKIDTSVLVAVYMKQVDATDSLMVTLFAFAGSIVLGYLGGNVWQKHIESRRPINNASKPFKAMEDESDDEQLPNGL